MPHSIVEFDASRGNEPFIRLPAPHPFILTPHRDSDRAQAMKYMEDPVVYMAGGENPPHPYAQSDWDSWLALQDPRAAASLAQLRAALDPDSPDRFTEGSPVESIRYVDPETQEHTFAGELNIRRSRFGEFALDQAKVDAAVAENEKLAVGDEAITWELGYYLGEPYRGRGVMGAAIRTLLEGYAVPYMNAKKVMADTFTSNDGSKRLLERCGFEMLGVVEDAVKMPEAKGGGMRSLNILRWKGLEQR